MSATDEGKSEDDGQKQIFLIDSQPFDDSKGEEHSVTTLRFGEKVLFDSLGPIVINTDGTTARISNWDKMTPKEKEVSWKRIKARNEKRLEVLKNNFED